MNRQNVNTVRNDGQRPLRDQLREVGLVLLHCTTDGALERTSNSSCDWLERIIVTAPLVQRGLKTATSGWNDQESPTSHEVLPGLWAAPIPCVERRKRAGYIVFFIPTVEFLQSEFLNACCQASRQDIEAVRRMLTQLDLPRRSDVPRLVAMARALYLHDEQLDDSQKTMEKVSQQLAESYEEISLLYALSQNMNVVQRPNRFITTACEGLLATLEYEWIGVQFASTEGLVNSLSGRFVVVGKPSESYYRVHRLTRQLLDQVDADTPLVIDADNQSNFANLRVLGRPLLVHPISREGRMMGVLLAGGKHGEDRQASSADMKLIGAAASHISIFLENAALYEDMNAMFLGTLEALTASIDAKDRYTCGHSQRVAHLSQRLAAAIGLDEDAVNRVRVAGLVHDVGKIGVPESVLSKPGHLTDDEFDLIKKHPEIGYRILKDIPQLRDILPGVLHHHERWDGRGYPHALKGDDIPLFARIIALADSFDAMSSTRTYREARDRATVLSEIQKCSGIQFDPDLVPAFVSLDFSEFDRMVTEHRAAEAHPARGGRAA